MAKSRRPNIFGNFGLPSSFDSSPKESNDEVTDQEKNCANFVMTTMKYVAGNLYVNSSFPEIARSDVAEMVDRVLTAFKHQVSGTPWIDEESEKGAHNKVTNMIRNIAYPDFETTDAGLDNYYKDLVKLTDGIDPEKYEAFFDYVKVLVAYTLRDMFGQVLRPGDRYDFLDSPAVVNDWYQPERNSITFPAAQLAVPFYNYQYPKAVNYGAFGATIGHELTHGFDDEGVQYDYNGTLNTWMTQSSQNGFSKMAQCIVDEYSSFCYRQACVSGVNTQGENIADNGGLKASYQAYKDYTYTFGDEGRLVGMEDYSMDQIFFIAYGYSWCGQFSDEFLTKLLLTNVHAPYPERVNGVVRNIPQFGEAFQCKLGDNLYPQKHCEVW